ncbi:DUF5133 domain-containing protein [Streptomyces lateritius]|nr:MULTISPECIES: DUF5133 domain-containing protein [Streptomyces]GGT78947.1 DUF5133 domain-containing protein [Streptomyces lateritius]
MLLPDRNTVDRLLRHYRAQERVVLARPCDLSIRRRFEDTAYTLCVLMGERTAREAVHAAERYVGKASPAGKPSPAGKVRPLAEVSPVGAATGVGIASAVGKASSVRREALEGIPGV